LLVGILRDPEFRSGAIDTGYLDRHDPASLMTVTDPTYTEAVHALVAALAAQAGRRAVTPVLPGLPSGWRTLPTAPQTVLFDVGDHRTEVRYRFDRGAVHASVDDWSPASLRMLTSTAQSLNAEIDGVRRHYRVTRCGVTYYVDSSLGSTTLREVERFPEPSAAQEAGSLLAPMPGAVVRVEVAEGDPVRAGMPILVLEAMKMEHTVRAPADGVVSAISVVAGQQVDSGQVLAVVTDEAGSP
jgi:acetyl/propionyl-CoA carboxylase alpha subunit